MFYEHDHSFSSEHLYFILSKSINCPPHMHTSFEVLICIEGEIEIRIDKLKYSLKKGEGVLCFPNQIHEYKTPNKSRAFICIFSPTYVKSYTPLSDGEKPEDNLFYPSKYITTALQALRERECKNVEIKGVLYSLCAEFDKDRRYSKGHKSNDELLGKIFSFLDENYKKVCSLESLSQHLGYNYVYLSRFFKETVGISFTEYVTLCRVNEAEYLLKNTKESILTIALDCGFNSLRSFNRNFKESTGLSPLEYRNKR